MSDTFERAEAAVRGGSVPDADLSEVLLSVLPMSGASVATFGEVFGNETVSMTDDRAGRIDELQFDLAEGPCWDALSSGVPVLAGDVRSDPPAAWPSFAEALRHEDVGSIAAFPLLFGPFRIGAIDLYSLEPVALEDDTVARVNRIAGFIGRRVLRRALANTADDGARLDVGPYSRRAVHQATGLVLAQLDITAEDAQLLIQGHAYASHRTMREVAEDIVAGRKRFVHQGRLIEESE